jgi:VWFA-related protein
MGITEFTEENNQSLKVPDGVFSNLIGPQKTPVPPTILLVDGLNTELTVQMQVHAQMVRMLRSLPSDTPVAVFLLGHRLRMVQSFTTDPSLLKAALQKASTAQPAGFEQIDPRDDPNALSAMEDLPPDILQRVQRFEQETYAATMDLRVQETLQALTAIARHVAGYPGRKSLLWVSSSFPLMLVADNNDFTSFRQYQTQMQDVADILADAKIAVYPVDPGGVQTQSYFQAGTSLRDRAVSNPQDTLGRESQMRMNSQATMETVAEQTGAESARTTMT